MHSSIKHRILIVDSDHSYAVSIKDSLEKEFGPSMSVDVFPDGESVLESMKKTGNKPHVLILNYLQNKNDSVGSAEYTVDSVKKESPLTNIIILSKEKNMDHALKALAHGAQTFVLKDIFELSHINAKVKNCLYPEIN